jgi:hypothetical protein
MSDFQRFNHHSNQDDLIKTKMLYEPKQGHLLSLGFGNVVRSEADVIYLSAFNNDAFTRTSAIGALADVIGYEQMLRFWPDDDISAGGCKFVDLQGYGLGFKYLMLISMGCHRSDGILQTANLIQKGLQLSSAHLRSLTSDLQVDVVALGTQFGQLDRRHCFDILTQWTEGIFVTASNVQHLRFVAYDLDTFVDFYDALHRQKNLVQQELSLDTQIALKQYGAFDRDVQTALKTLSINPLQVIVICRTIAEKVARQLYVRHFKVSCPTLFEAINTLHESKHLPGSIFSYLHTCRVLGNFSNHASDFDPSPKDAQGVMFLTLRIVEWFLELGDDG